VSGLRSNKNGKALCNPKSFPPASLARLSRVKPHDSTAKAWLDDCRLKLGTWGLCALGIPPRQAIKGGPPIAPLAQRLVFIIWSSLFCPSNLSSALHLATWGRFNPKMPKDYTLAAERLLARKTGPARARAAGERYRPFVKPWARRTPSKGEYLALPNLPLL